MIAIEMRYEPLLTKYLASHSIILPTPHLMYNPYGYTSRYVYEIFLTDEQALACKLAIPYVSFKRV